jgi:hypothetical protein
MRIIKNITATHDTSKQREATASKGASEFSPGHLKIAQE